MCTARSLDGRAHNDKAAALVTGGLAPVNAEHLADIDDIGVHADAHIEM